MIHDEIMLKKSYFYFTYLQRVHTFSIFFLNFQLSLPPEQNLNISEIKTKNVYCNQQARIQNENNFLNINYLNFVHQK